jgi:hypothetical protein
MLQSDMATSKAQLDHLEESIDTKISNLQTNLESNLTRQISALESKMISEFGNQLTWLMHVAGFLMGSILGSMFVRR